MVNPRSPGFQVFFATTVVAFFAVSILPVICAFLPPEPISANPSEWFTPASSRLWDFRRARLLMNSLSLALGTALFSGLLGTTIGFALEYFRAQPRKLLLFGVAASFLIPPHVSAVAWIDILGANGLLAGWLKGWGFEVPVWSPKVYSLGGAIFVLALSYYPLIAFATLLALRRIEPRMEEAALLFSSPWRTIGHVLLPAAFPTIATAVLLVFVLSLVSFSVPSLLTVKVYTVEIYSRFSSFHDFTETAMLAVPLVLCGAVGTICLRRVELSIARTQSSTQLRDHITRRVNRKSSAGATAISWAVVALAAGFPLPALMIRALPLASFTMALDAARTEILTSLVIAGVSATGMVILGFCLAYVHHVRSTGICTLSFISFLVSGPVLGIGLIRLWNHPGIPGAVYDSMAIVLLACIGRYLVFSYEPLAVALDGMPRPLEEAARVHGAAWHREMFFVALPSVLPTLVAAWGLGFVFALGELDTVILVYPPGYTPLSVRLFSLMHYGPSSVVAALSLINAALVLASAILVAYAYQWARRTHHAGY